MEGCSLQGSHAAAVSGHRLLDCSLQTSEEDTAHRQAGEQGAKGHDLGRKTSQRVAGGCIPVGWLLPGATRAKA